MAAFIDAAERDPTLSNLHVQLTERRREPLRHVLAQARQRGDIPFTTDLELAVDLLTGPAVSRFCNLRRIRIMSNAARPDQLLRLGFQYYVTGRWAMRCSYRIGPNLFHHAVELIMKYQLLRTVANARQADEQRKLSRKPYGHNLPDRLWPDYKAEVGDPALDRFDQVIATLDRWEALRYAGFPNGLSTEMMLNPSRSSGARVAAVRFDSHECAIDDIDQLIAAMLRASSFNLNIISDQWLHNPEVRRAYQQDNKSSLIPIPNSPLLPR